MQWVLNGLPVEATYLTSSQNGCEIAAARAKDWRRTNKAVVEQRVGDWCVVGTVADGYWVSEQWRVHSAAAVGATGWRVRTLLRGLRMSTGTTSGGWQIDMVDPQISARIQFRSSHDDLQTHHTKTLSVLTGESRLAGHGSVSSARGRGLLLSRTKTGTVVLSGAATSGRYSVVIQKIGER
jgi:hypothetical protein